MNGTHGAACHGDGRARSGTSDAEVGYFRDLIPCDKDVLRLDVPVDDAVGMCIIEGHADLDDDGYSMLPVEVTVLIDEVLDRDAVHIFLDDITECAFVAYAEYLNDVVLLE